MKRSETRYPAVWDAGYNAAIEAIDMGLRRFIEEGGEVKLSPFGEGFIVRRSSGLIGHTKSMASSLIPWELEGEGPPDLE